MRIKYGSVNIVSRIRSFSIEDGIWIISGKINLQHDIDLPNDRYDCFLRNGVNCYRCNLSGSYFALEYVSSKSYSGYSLNLYGKRECGAEEYFTKDHLIPKSAGGADDISNYNTMCWTCNHKKGSSLL